MALVSIKNLTVSYGAAVALEKVNLDIFEDDFLGVIGPNGGGKSTLMKAILGLVSYSGTIIYDKQLNKNFRDGRNAQKGRRGSLSIGYLPQINTFDTRFPIEVEEVVVSGLQSGKGLTGRFVRSDYEAARALLNEVGIGHLAKKAVGELSGGELQRALLCRAIISKPRMLILDEPTNFVDNKFEKQLYSTMRELNKHMAIVMVSHDLGTISSVVRSIVCVNRHVHRHNSNIITAEQLNNYDCPIQIISHGHIPHTVLAEHK